RLRASPARRGPLAIPRALRSCARASSPPLAVLHLSLRRSRLLAGDGASRPLRLDRRAAPNSSPRRRRGPGHTARDHRRMTWPGRLGLHANPIRRYMMGAILVHEFMSLDGVIDTPTWTFDYGFDPKMGEAISSATERADGILLGRTTYEMFEPAWSTRTVE